MSVYLTLTFPLAAGRASGSRRVPCSGGTASHAATVLPESPAAAADAVPAKPVPAQSAAAESAGATAAPVQVRDDL